LDSRPPQSKAPATRIMKLLGALAACIFAIAIPFWYYLLSVSEIRDSLTIETALLAKSVEKIIQTRPDMWEFESARLQEMISQPTIEGKLHDRIIRTAAGTVVAKTDTAPERPVISTSVALFDSGRPVGSFEARHSIRTPVVFTALLGILSSFFGGLIYVIFRTYPIKKLDTALADLQRAEEEQRRDRETAERLAEEMAVIAEIGQLIGSTLDIDEVYEPFAAGTRKLILFDSITVNLYNVQEKTLCVAYVSGFDIDGRRQGDPLVLEGSLSEAVIRTRTSLCIQPASIDEIVGQFPRLTPIFQAGLRSIMCVPLIYRDEAIGVLHFRSKKPAAYSEDDLRLAERIATQIAGAIVNAKLFADLKRAEEEQRLSRETAERLSVETAVIADIGRLISSTLEIDEVYEWFSVEVRKLIPFDRTSINLCNLQENTMRISYVSGAEIADRKQGYSAPLAGTLSDLVVRERASRIIQTDHIDEIVSRIPTLLPTLQAGVRSIISVPLISRDQAIGVLHLRSNKPNAYTEQDLRLAERIGAQIAGAIANAQLFTDLKKAEEKQRLSRETAERLTEETALIAEIGRLIGSTLDIDEVYERFAAETKKLIPFDRLAVNQHSPHEDNVKVAFAFGMKVPGRCKGDWFPLKGSACEVLTKTRAGLYDQPKHVEEMSHPSSNPYASVKAGMRSLLRVPLIYRDEVIGSLHFGSKTPDVYTDRELHLAERIGAQIAGAIGTAKLIVDLTNTEHSLRDSERRFRSLVEQAAVGVAEIDMITGLFLTVNRRLFEMVGRTEEELLATTFQAITHPEDLQLHVEKTRMMLAGEIRHYSLEKRYIRKDGEAVWVNITVSPLWNPGEAPGRNIAVVEDITERKRMEAEMREMSLRDLLTDLYNRRGFITLAEQQIKAANRAQRPLQLTFIDCDRLKWINDTLGHEEGDRALIDTANVLRQTFRESDIIARLGGDEFAILSIDAADMNQEDFSRRLQQNIDADNAKESRQYKLSLSWGTAIYNPESPISLDQLISAADGLMYAQKKAKSNSRN
jgi:diguanylate cyclase (GGDEF)-like protein/PAS domain S-box-containing protein